MSQPTSERANSVDGEVNEGTERMETENGEDYFEGDDQEVDLMDGENDLASSDSELQVKDPSQ